MRPQFQMWKQEEIRGGEGSCRPGVDRVRAIVYTYSANIPEDVSELVTDDNCLSVACERDFRGLFG